MLAPSIFGRGIFDDFNDFWGIEPTFRHHVPDFRKMSTDVKELENGYEIDMELPGFKKEEVTAELKDGYLTISAKMKRKMESISVRKDIMENIREAFSLATILSRRTYPPSLKTAYFT